MSWLGSIFRSPQNPGAPWDQIRRLKPVSRVFGLDRGQPIDRYYIEKFLHENKNAIRGAVLEIGSPDYTRRFGEDRVQRSEVLHVQQGNPHATIVGDLATGQGIPIAAFDCLILTQTFPFIYDLAAAVRHTYDALKPGGVLLATFPGISQISRHDAQRWGDFWRLTEDSSRRLFGGTFGSANLVLSLYGNVLVACAFLHGLAAHELTPDELDLVDPDYPVLITVRAVKPTEGPWA